MKTTFHGKDNLTALRGRMLSFNSNPFLKDERDSFDYIEDALIVVKNGKVEAAGEYSKLKDNYADLTTITEYKDALIIPGLIDCHCHYVQTPMIGSCGNSLLEWLNEYTFPTEERFFSKELADDVAAMFFKQILGQGTTTANVFATTYATSVDAFFEESERYGCRMICGKVLQDRNVPERLRDKSPEESVEVSRQLLKKWHGKGRQLYAVVPRFAPTSTPRQLQLAGELYQEFLTDGVYLHTHLDEAEAEIRWVKELFPHAASYTDVYRHFGLLGANTVMAHCCIMKEEEWRLLYESGSSVAHCPSSNLFLGDGEFKMWDAIREDRPLKVGIGTDVGGGTNFSVLRQLGEAYKVTMLKGRSLNALKSLYLATLGGASALGLEKKIGRIAQGYEADFAVIDLKPTEFAEWRTRWSRDLFETLFVLFALSYDNLVLATYVGGKKVYDSKKEVPIKYASEL